MRNRIVLASFAVAASFALAACGSSDTGTSAGASSAPTTSMTSAAPMPSASAMDTSAQFGPACASVPTDASDPGSFAAMAKVPVATAASGNPVLKTLVAAVTKAGLGDTLNSAQGITVFAPADSAFGKVPADTLNALLADQTKLTSVLKYHVVAGRLSPDQLAGQHMTLEGSSLTVTGSGTSFTVDGSAQVVCGNVQTSNATVYIIDSVLMPKS